MSRTDDRLAELLGAAAAGELTEAEHRELDAWADDDPAVRAERDALVGLAGRVGGLGSWDDGSPSPTLEDAVVDRARRRAPVVSSPRGARRRLGLAAAAVALVAAGVGGTLAVQSVTESSVQGPPGTLGAHETVVFEPSPGGAQVDAALVAHTWGTEAVLTIDGLEPGEVYDVYFVDEEGRQVGAGAFLGSEVTIDCRMNAAVMREDVTSLRIEGADGTVVRAAELPQVRG